MTWLTTINDHELVEVGNRRWCVTCDLFQIRGRQGFGPIGRKRPRNTPYARWLKLEREEIDFKETSSA